MSKTRGRRIEFRGGSFLRPIEDVALFYCLELLTIFETQDIVYASKWVAKIKLRPEETSLTKWMQWNWNEFEFKINERHISASAYCILHWTWVYETVNLINSTGQTPHCPWLLINPVTHVAVAKNLHQLLLRLNTFSVLPWNL